MVASALMTVSPDNSRIRRSTPCVLGCCGPMLTVIVSLRSSGISVTVAGCQLPTSWLPATGHRLLATGIYQLAHDVQQRPMDFLHARRVLIGHVDVDLGGGAHRSAVAPRQCDRSQAPLARDLQRGEDVRRLAARGDPRRNVPGLAQRCDLTRESVFV